MIGKLTIKNFKSVKDLELECKRINLFFGEPSTGKSNILEVVGLLSHAYYGSLRQSAGLKGFVRFAYVRDLFYNHEVGRPIEVLCNGNSLRIEFKDGFYAATYRGSKGATKVLYSHEGSVSRREPEPSFSTVLDEFSAFKFYRFSPLTVFMREESGFLLPPNGSNLMAILLTRKDLRAIVRELFARFGLKLVLKPEERKIEAQREVEEDIIISLPYHVVSDTLRRVIFHLAAIQTNRDSVITFEEPEAHSFPFYTRYLAERIALDRNRNQYFISTHNPYFLLSILEKAPAEDVAAYVTYLEDYETKVKLLSREDVEEILEGGIDAFFNLDRFLGQVVEHRLRRRVQAR